MVASINRNYNFSYFPHLVKRRAAKYCSADIIRRNKDISGKCRYRKYKLLKQGMITFNYETNLIEIFLLLVKNFEI